MFLRQFAVLVGLFVAVLGSQLPEFSQQYRQRLGGAVDEIKRAVAAFEAEAENQSLTFEQAVERLKENADPLARQRAADMEADAARERRLEAAQADMAGAGPLMRLLAMLRDFDPEIAHRANRLGAARHGDERAQRRDQRRALMPGFHRREQRAGADAGHEDDRVELAGKQLIGEIERSAIVVERDFAHRRCDDGDAAAALDHGCDLIRHPAFEGDHAQSAEAGGKVRAVRFCFRVHRRRQCRLVNLAAPPVRRPLS